MSPSTRSTARSSVSVAPIESEKMMKKGKTLEIVYKALYALSALLALTFVAFCVIQTYRYYTRFTGSAPLYAYFIIYAFYYLIPSIIVLIAAIIVKKIFKSKNKKC